VAGKRFQKHKDPKKETFPEPNRPNRKGEIDFQSKVDRQKKKTWEQLELKKQNQKQKKRTRPRLKTQVGPVAAVKLRMGGPDSMM